FCSAALTVHRLLWVEFPPAADALPLSQAAVFAAGVQSPDSAPGGDAPPDVDFQNRKAPLQNPALFDTGPPPQLQLFAPPFWRIGRVADPSRNPYKSGCHPRTCGKTSPSVQAGPPADPWVPLR